STSYSSTIERNALTPEIEKEDEQQPERESGHARKEQSERPSWEKDQLNAEQAILKSQFDTAASLLERALREAKNSPTKPSRLALTRLALATIYLKQERYPEAFKAFELSDNKLRCELSPDSKEYARCQIGLARCLVEFGKEEKAIEHAKKAIAILKKGNQTNSQLYGYCLHTLAMANARHGWSEEARPLFTEALEIFDKYPGFKRLDLARILRDQAIFHYRLGSRKLSKELYEKSSKIKEQAMVSEQPAAIAGEVRFVWEPGSTRSCEIIDNEFPFRYITVGGVRVAATVVDLWELIAVLITVTNVSDQQSEYELGKVRLSLVSKVSPISEPVVVAPVDHNS
ncbi:MAG: tetratricopeptide repeat protein, partial [Candidatus Obscuribacterales bacterium]|nr:tetratricopeptide repeat protein [Candidatus Obscuribacterales bacterium]